MIVAGKCPPEKEELEEAAKRGFENTELYLEKQHLDRFEETIENCKEAKINVVSVHTPHVSKDEPRYFNQAGKLAENLDAKLVFHSSYFHHFNIPDLEDKTDITVKYGYENNPGASKFAIQNLILGRGHQIVLDTAHLFIAEEDFQFALEYFINEQAERIEVLHLCDSTTTEDGLKFGEGEIDMENTCQKISDSDFDGILVLEVMPSNQEDALQKWKSYTL